MTVVVLTLFLCGPSGCVEERREFPQFRSCSWVNQLAQQAVSRAWDGSWARCEEVQR